MIQIELLKKNGDYVSLKLKGHAGYNYNGNDVNLDSYKKNCDI